VGNSTKLRELLRDESYQHINVAFVAYSSDVHQTAAPDDNNPLLHTIDVEQDGCNVFGPFEHVSTTFPYVCEEDETLFHGNKVSRVLA
jgi:hypothetical protein